MLLQVKAVSQNANMLQNPCKASGFKGRSGVYKEK